MVERKACGNLKTQNMDISNPPSIGSKELSFDEGGNRVRQIVETIVASEKDLRNILQNTEDFGSGHGATRSIVRAFTPSGLLIDRQIGMFCREAEIPLAGDFGGLYLSYFSWNSPDRRSPNHVLEQERSIIQDILKRPTKAPLTIFEKARDYSLESLKGELDSIDYNRLREMYRASFTSYPFDIEDSIKSMVQNEGYEVYAARSKSDGLLYAVSVTEEVSLNLSNGKKFIMREMGDSAKMPETNGLNAPLKLMLIERAFTDGVDLVFCESRAALPQVNAVNNDIGMRYCGLLMQHTKIGGEGIDEKSPYGNMNVWALNKDGIRKIGQEVNSLAL